MKLARAGLLAFGLAAGLTGGAEAAGCTQPPAADRALAEVVARVNAERAAEGLAALARSPALDRAAQDHACWMAGPGAYGHRGAGGSTPKARVRATGYRACLTAENIAWGQNGAADVMGAWMSPSGHRDNILRRNLREIGVGVALLDGRPAWVEVLAGPC